MDFRNVLRTLCSPKTLVLSVIAYAVFFGFSQTVVFAAPPNLYTHFKLDNTTTDAQGASTLTFRGGAAFSSDAAPISSSTASMFLTGANNTHAIASGNLFNNWNQGTVSMWVKIASSTAAGWANNSNRHIVFKYRIIEARIFKNASGQLRLSSSHGNGAAMGTAVVSTSNIATNTWVHIATVHQGQTVTQYINGVPAGSGSTGRTLGSVSADNFEISTYGAQFRGNIDDIQVYNRALTAAEIAEISGSVPPPPDTTAPVISVVASSAVTQNSATISWTTNEASDTQVEYGTTTLYGATTTLSTTLSTAHSVNLGGLSQATTYQYRVRSRDAAGNLATATSSFTTGSAPILHTITASSGANGSISPSGSVQVTQGASQAFTITPNSGYFISSLLVDGSPVATTTSYTFTNVTAPHTISAAFTLIPDTAAPIISGVAVSNITQTGATITWTTNENADTQVAYGLTTSYSASTTLNTTLSTAHSATISGLTSGTLYNFSVRSRDAAGNLGFSSNTTFTTATPATFIISANAGANGSISPSGSVVVSQGASQAFNITANSGYQISNVLVNGTSVGTPSSYTFTNVQSAQTIVASFATTTTGAGFQINNSYISGLEGPTSMTFTPDGRMLITEQIGRVRVVLPDGTLLPTPMLTLTNQLFDQERGLLGIAVDPDFAVNQYVYVFYTPLNPARSRVSRFTVNGNIANPATDTLIFEYENISGNHRGGDIHFGGDGKLYIALGDAAESANSQTVTSFNGKILRLNADGSIPADNPTTFTNTSGTVLTPVGAYRAIWAMGLRNPYRFSFDPASGKMHINDVGSDQREEINLGQAGKNYGWPTCEGNCANPNAENPLHSYQRGEPGQCAITGSVFIQGNQFPSSYNNNYFFSDYCGTWIRNMQPNNSVQSFPLAVPEGPSDLKFSPDGSLYVAGYNAGVISKITYNSGTTTNQAPTARITATPTQGQSPLLVSFSGLTSTDPEGNPLTYSWNFGDGATTTGATTTHTYVGTGSYSAVLTVRDAQNASHAATTTISVGNTPVATITLPGEGALYNAGDTINFAGTATDTEDGVLPASAFSWTIVFHHHTHTHPFQGPFTNTTTGSFTIPTTGHTEDDVWYRINLTVTDSSGLQHQVFRDVYPRTVTVTLASNIPGAQILLDGQPRTATSSFVSVVNVVRTIEAPATQTIAGQAYDFVSWSNGGSRLQTINTPATNTTYTANYQVSAVPTVPNPNIHWKFNNNLTETVTLYEAAGRGSYAFSTDSAPISGNSASLSLNGLDDTYVVSAGDDIMNAWPNATTAMWVKIATSTAAGWANYSDHALLFKYGVMQSKISKDDTGQIRFVASHGNAASMGYPFTVSSSTVPIGTWVHLATVHQGQMVTLYINGQFAGTGNTGRVFGGASTDVLDIIGHGGMFNGLVDDLRFYNQALTQGQIAALMTQ